MQYHAELVLYWTLRKLSEDCVNQTIFYTTLLLTCSIASAETTVDYGFQPSNDTGNIVFHGAGTRTSDTPLGRVNFTDFLFGFSSSSGELVAFPDGHPRVEALDHTFTHLSFLSIEHTFSSALFNLRVNANALPVGHAASGLVFLTIDLFGQPDYKAPPLALNVAGDNVYFLHSTSHLIEGFTIESTLHIRDVRQMTIEGIDELPQSGGSDTPEPATSILTVAAGAALVLVRPHLRARFRV